MEPADAVSYMLERGQIEIHQVLYLLCFLWEKHVSNSKHLNNTFSWRTAELVEPLLGYFTEKPPLGVDL